jgi:sugar/nucleoside kinase (ribokinase family)
VGEDVTRVLLLDLVERGASLGLATRGTDGAIVYDGHSYVAAAAERIADPSTIVDTMGCGDAFMAAFAVSLLGAGWSRAHAPTSDALLRALHAGATFATRQCFVEGAFGRAQVDPMAAVDTM